MMNERGSKAKAGRKSSSQTQGEGSTFSICTANDPFGRGGKGSSTSIGPASSLSRSQVQYEQEVLQKEAELGFYFIGPVLKTWELTLKGPPALAMGVYRAYETLHDNGTDRLALNQMIELSISIAVDAAAKRARILKENAEFLKKLAETITGSVIDNSSGNKFTKKTQTYKEPGDSLFVTKILDKWDSDQDQTQAGVDSYEERQRNYPGSMIA
jgi:hypothetical protein